MSVTKTKRELAIEQIELMEVIRDKANINMVTCGNCGTILLHKRSSEGLVECFGCMREMDQSDCPDYWYDNCENNAEFNEDSRN